MVRVEGWQIAKSALSFRACPGIFNWNPKDSKKIEVTYGMERKYFLYMMANYSNTVLYLGVTNNIKRRAVEHRESLLDGFTKKYHCTKLVWFEPFDDIRFAIEKEKVMKKWPRAYKENLINEMNPNWDDLFDSI